MYATVTTAYHLPNEQLSLARPLVPVGGIATMALDKLSAKGKIYLIDDLHVGDKYVTPVKISEDVRDELGEFLKRDKPKAQHFLGKLEYYATFGFSNFISKYGPIKPEWDQVYRIGIKGSLFRIYGFFENRTRAFIALRACMKRGKVDRGDINEVARTKKSGTWKPRPS